MKYVLITVAFIALASCESGTKKRTEPEKQAKKETATVAGTKECTKWIDDFRAFRDAVYQNIRKKVKEYVDFPLTENVNYVWSITGDETKFGDTVPFTERDFDKYYDKLFTKEFIKCLLKIKSEELYKTGQVSSPEKEQVMY